MTNLAIRIAANGMRNGWGRGTGIRRGRHWRLEYFPQRGSVQSNKFPVRSVTRTIRTEGRIVFAAGVVGIVTRLARGIVGAAMFVQPSGRLVRVRFVDRGN